MAISFARFEYVGRASFWMFCLRETMPRLVIFCLACGGALRANAQTDLRWINDDPATETIRLDSLPLVAEELMPLPFYDDEFYRPPPAPRDFAAAVVADYRNYYSADTLLPLVGGLAVGAAFANTHADQGIRDFYQENIRDASTDDYWKVLHTPTVLGNGYVMLPLFAAAAAGGRLTEQSASGRIVGEWGERSLRTFLVGAPPMFALQYLTGGSRPGEMHYESTWNPLHDSNGVSGHSFMGAIPFLAAAQMTEDPWLRAGFYGASTLAGLSRINDDAHFTSQVMIGWWTAFLASEAIRMTSDGKRSWHIVPMPARDGFMLGLEIRR